MKYEICGETCLLKAVELVTDHLRLVHFLNGILCFSIALESEEKTKNKTKKVKKRCQLNPGGWANCDLKPSHEAATGHKNENVMHST